MSKTRFKIFLVIVSTNFMTGCFEKSKDSTAYTLYRNSVVLENERMHIATFDSDDGESYNQENCFLAKDLFLAQPGVMTKFWCEKGRYKK